MIVVSDTSPLTNLAAIGRLDVLRQLYGEVYIPNAVWDELNAGDKNWPGYESVATANWIKQHGVQNQPLVVALRRDLDRGEAEGIALALELKADLILLVEKEGRHAAQQLGLQVVGVIGVLLEAKAKGLLPQVRSQLDALRQLAGFYLSESLYQAAMKLAGE